MAKIEGFRIRNFKFSLRAMGGCNKSWRLQAVPTIYCVHNAEQPLYIVVWDGQYITFVTAPSFFVLKSTGMHIVFHCL